EGAIGLIHHESGKALDPMIVEKFIELLPLLAAQAAAEERKLQPAARAPQESSGTPATGFVPERMPQTAFENIALAHREIYALYEIAQAMGTSLGVADTMALISTKLTNIVPWSACTLFLYNQESDTLKCRFAAGVDVPKLLDLVIKNGEGLAGWVARNRRTIVNGNPRATFDSAGVLSGIDLKSAIACPLLLNDPPVGSVA